MSADDYYTVKKDNGGKFVPAHGFMSSLEDGHTAQIHPRDPRFDTWEGAARHAMKQWSEYGLIEEFEGSE